MADVCRKSSPNPLIQRPLNTITAYVMHVVFSPVCVCRQRFLTSFSPAETGRRCYGREVGHNFGPVAYHDDIHEA